MHAASTVRPTPFATSPLPRVPMSVLAALALVAAATLWGTSFVAAKVVLGDLPPIAVAFLRFAIAAGFLVPLACRRGGRPRLGVEPALLGLTGVALFFLCQNVGLRQASASHATLIMSGGIPVLTALFAAWWLGERPARRQMIGLACSLAGVGAVAAVGEGAGSSFQGVGLLVLAAASGAAYVVLGRRAFMAPDPFGVLAGSTLWGAILLAPPAAIEAMVGGGVSPSPGSLVLLLYLGLGCSAVAFACCAFGLRHLTATQNAVIGALELPIGLATAALLLGEVLGPAQVAGALLLLAGAVLAIDRGTAAASALPHPDREMVYDDRAVARVPAPA